MNRFDREHVDGIGDGLSIAIGILESCGSIAEARERVKEKLIEARRAKDLDNLDLLSRLTSAGRTH